MPRATEVEWLEQDVGGAIAKRVLELVDHQAVAVATETFQGNGRARHVPAQALQFPALSGFASNGGIEREAVALGREGLRRRAPFEPGPGVCRRRVLRPAIGPTAIR